MKMYGDLIDRVGVLRKLGNPTDRARVRAVMNGGAQGVQAVLNWDTPAAGPGSGKGASTNLGVDLPTANILHSGLERLAQKIGRPPTLKTDMIPTRDTSKARAAAEKRARIVNAWDEIDRVELQYPQIGRWLPGYGFTIHVIRERDFGGITYPVSELRDPYDVYPGMWGPNQQPTEVAIVRHMSHKLVKQTYPQFGELFDVASARKSRGGGIPIIGQTSGWEGNPHHPIEIIEYMCGDGTYVICPEIERTIAHIPNPLTSGPAFVITKRFSFDMLQGQFHHAFGLMAMMGKLNILGLIATEDSVFRETNIIGEMVGNTYERGRKAVNQFETGARIEKPTSDQLQQTWQAINILERQLRTVAGYPVADDGQSPNSFATGQGIRELQSGADSNVKEYQTAIRHSIEIVDQKRLEWEEKMHASTKKRVYWYEGGTQFEETYVPKIDIAGDYRTQRIYGAMATFDENSKIIAGLQLVQARIMDRRTMQENMDGFQNVTLMNERMDEDMAKEMLIQALGAQASERDPAATAALVRIMNKPKDTNDMLSELFDPEEQEGMSAQDMQAQAMAAGMGGPPGAGMEAGPPPAVQTILAQMESEGGGAMSVGQMR